MRHSAQGAAACLLLLATAAGAPARHLNYAESANRLVFAIVFGHRDTCRVYRRAEPPSRPLEQLLRFPPGEGYEGGPGEDLLTEFVFGSGRPIHMVPTNDGKYLVTFANRAATAEASTQDRILSLADRSDFEVVRYDAVPLATEPSWPDLPRALAGAPDVTEPMPVSAYAFLHREAAPDRLLVARQTEEREDLATDPVCFVLQVPSGSAALPEAAELHRLLQDGEPLWRASAAWAIGMRGDRADLAALAAALGRSRPALEQAAVVEAMVRCGDEGARRVLRAMLADERDAGARRLAATALAHLPPHPRDAVVLSGRLTDADARTALLAGRALARHGPAGVNALVRASRTTRTEVRVAAATVLGRMPEEKAEVALLALGRDADEVVQTAVARALTRPPRAILERNQAEFARVLATIGRAGNREATRRLVMLAAHASMRHESVLEALVDVAGAEPRAVWALARLTGEPLETAEDCRAWWTSRRGS